MGTQAISAFMRIKMGIKTVLMVFASRFGSVLMMCDIAPLKFIMTWGALFGAIEFTYQLEAHGGGVYKPMLEIAPAGFWQFWWGSYVSTRAIGVICSHQDLLCSLLCRVVVVPLLLCIQFRMYQRDG